jgi:hypothetical protein
VTPVCIHHWSFEARRPVSRSRHRAVALLHATACRKALVLAACWGAVLAAPELALAENAVQSVVVLEYVARNGEELPATLGGLLAERIRAGAEKTGRVAVVPDSAVRSILDEMGSDYRRVSTLGRATALAESLGARMAVFGSYESYGTVVKVTSQLATVGARRLRMVEVAEHLGSRTLDEIADAVADEIVPLLAPSEAAQRSLTPERDELVPAGRKKPVKGGGWASLALAAGAAAGAVYGHGKSNDEWDRYLAEIDPDLMKRRYDEANRHYTLRNVSLAVGGAALLSAAYYFYYKDYGGTEEWASRAPLPTIGIGDGAVAVALSWPLPGGD